VFDYYWLGSNQSYRVIEEMTNYWWIGSNESYRVQTQMFNNWWTGRNISYTPVVTTNDATGIGTTNATLQGTLVSDGEGIHVHVGFEWGLDTSYGNLSQLPPIYVYAAGATTQKIYQYWVSNMTKIRESADYGGAIYDIIADDVYVYAAGETQEVYQYYASNLTFRANTSDYGGFINAVIADEYYVYAAGYTTQTIRQYYKTNMTMKAESADYGGTINAITEDEYYVYIGGYTTQKVWQLYKTNLTKRMETPDYGGTIWSVIVSMNGTQYGDYIYAGGATTQTVRRYYKTNGTFVDETANYGGVIRALAQDDYHIYAAGTVTQKVYRYWKTNMTKESETDSYGGAIWEIASDSTCPYIYAGGTTTQKVYQYWMSNMTKAGESESYGGNIRTLTTYPHDYISGEDFYINTTGLSPATTYHYRAYASNEYSSAVGADKSFTTLGLPAVIIITNVYPGNNSFNVPLQPVVYATFNHSNGSQMNISWYYGDSPISCDNLLETDTLVTNGTYSTLNYNASNRATYYYWRIQADDNINYVNESYSFKTEGYMNMAPSGGNVSPITFGIIGLVGIVGLLSYFLTKRRTNYDNKKEKKRNNRPW
jgi:hypothetical protein